MLPLRISTRFRRPEEKCPFDTHSESTVVNNQQFGIIHFRGMLPLISKLLSEIAVRTFRTPIFSRVKLPSGSVFKKTT